MNQSVFIHVPAWILAVFIFFFILLFIWLGTAYRNYELRKGKERLIGGLGSLENAMLTLLGLLLAFTFGMAVSKFENRRKDIVDESNAIGTAILRCDLYPASFRDSLKRKFHNYVEARIAYYNAGTDNAKIQIALDDASTSSSEIWKQVTSVPNDVENLARTTQMIPAMNAVIDIVSIRDADRKAKIPPLILLTLFLLTITGGFLVGYDQASSRRSKTFLIGFAFMTTVTIYLIMELDRPRSGLINLDAAEQYIINLRTMVNL